MPFGSQFGSSSLFGGASGGQTSGGPSQLAQLINASWFAGAAHVGGANRQSISPLAQSILARWEQAAGGGGQGNTLASNNTVTGGTGTQTQTAAPAQQTQTQDPTVGDGGGSGIGDSGGTGG